jgi:hypothetical protein
MQLSIHYNPASQGDSPAAAAAGSFVDTLRNAVPDMQQVSSGSSGVSKLDNIKCFFR